MESYNGLIFDSREEVWFAMWCHELKEAGYIKYWTKVTEPLSILEPLEIEYIKKTQLKTKVKHENKTFTLLKGLEYTPDFYIQWTLKGFKTFVSSMDEDVKPDSWFFAGPCKPGSPLPSFIGYIEVKPSFDQHGKTARFSIMQKIIWNTKEIFVDLIIVEDLFKGTFIPKEVMPEFKYKKAPRTGQWKVKYQPKTLEEYVRTTDKTIV
jgi:hypothetical protein